MFEACSVFVIHYKYIAEVLEKNIRSTEFIDHSFERQFYGAALKTSARAKSKICNIYAVQCTYSTFIFTYTLYIMKYNTKVQLTTNMYIVQCIDYIGIRIQYTYVVCCV